MKPSSEPYIVSRKHHQKEMFDNPELDIFFCRSFTFKKMRIKYVSRKFKKVRYMTQFRKVFCLARMKIVPAHTYNKKYFAHYAYCPQHNMKIVLGY